VTARVLAIVLALAGAAAADDEIRSPTAATWLSIGVTAGGAGIAAASFASSNRRVAVMGSVVGVTTFLIGPSVGHWYAGNYREGLGGWLRGGAIVIGVVAVFAIPAECDDNELDGSCASPRKWPVAATMFGIGAGLLIAGTVYDIVTAADEARRYNRRWRLAPAVGPGTAGLSVMGSW
jgi:hypothetical protein